MMEIETNSQEVSGRGLQIMSNLIVLLKVFTTNVTSPR